MTRARTFESTGERVGRLLGAVLGQILAVVLLAGICAIAWRVLEPRLWPMRFTEWLAVAAILMCLGRLSGFHDDRPKS